MLDCCYGGQCQAPLECFVVRVPIAGQGTTILSTANLAQMKQ